MGRNGRSAQGFSTLGTVLTLKEICSRAHAPLDESCIVTTPVQKYFSLHKNKIVVRIPYLTVALHLAVFDKARSWTLSLEYLL